MLTINDLKPGALIVIDTEPFQVLEVAHQHIGRGGSSIQTKIKNIITGQVLSRNFKPAGLFEEADVEKRPLIFLYQHRGDFVFSEPEKPLAHEDETRPEKSGRQNRFTVKEEMAGEVKKWIKPGAQITGVFFNEELISFILPVKVDLEVKEAPPGLQGDRSQAGSKSITLETDTIIQAPLFINAGDIIRVNTETGEYAERVKKA